MADAEIVSKVYRGETRGVVDEIRRSIGFGIEVGSTQQSTVEAAQQEETVDLPDQSSGQKPPQVTRIVDSTSAT